MRALALLALVAVAALAGGCNSGKATPEKRQTAATVVDVVEKNMMDAEAGNAAAYCAAYTPRYLRVRYHGGVAACVKRFRGAPARLVNSNEVRYLGAVIDPDISTLAAVHYKLGDTRGLDYVMRLTTLPGGRKRWLIDDRAVPQE